MARCGCGSGTCSCRITQGVGISVTGDGAAANPFIINAIGGGTTGGNVILWHTGDAVPTVAPTSVVILIQNSAGEATPAWAPSARTVRLNLA